MSRLRYQSRTEKRTAEERGAPLPGKDTDGRSLLRRKDRVDRKRHRNLPTRKGQSLIPRAPHIRAPDDLDGIDA